MVSSGASTHLLASQRDVQGRLCAAAQPRMGLVRTQASLALDRLVRIAWVTGTDGDMNTDLRWTFGAPCGRVAYPQGVGPGLSPVGPDERVVLWPPWT